MPLTQVKAEEHFSDLFNQLLSIEAYGQWQQLNHLLENMQLNDANDIWRHMGQKQRYQAARVYKTLIGHIQVHPSFRWLWKANCQPKNKVFFFAFITQQTEYKRNSKEKERALGFMHVSTMHPAKGRVPQTSIYSVQLC